MYTVHTMARIRIDLDSAIPATRQIADALRVELVEGRLQPGHVLPSVRRAAVDLGLHFNTVAEAYRQLAAEGWLDLKHGRGARVADRKQQPAASRQATAGYRQRLRELVSQMRADGVPPQNIADELRALAEGVKP
jgi:DNA-binding transcriptional regulator YhcF (GntR family)